MVILTPQILLRMFQEESLPVRTPSYIPQLSVYYNLQRFPAFSNFNLFSRFVHHSNGQEGSFYLQNGEINYRSGNFATNYFETGLIVTNYNSRFKAMQFYSTTFEIHPKGMHVSELDGKFSTFRWHSAFSVFKLHNCLSSDQKGKAQFSLKGKTSFLFGEINDWKAFDQRRLELSFTLAYYPLFLEDIGFFVSIYRGMDYYNIYFDRQLSLALVL